ncbi:MAG TPA: nitrite/sulfite reductase [Kiritimatiellia bacterium]|nr:nitrite/sulfite reductase [Kiritimatiellia bacterium]HRU70348.1 nitrite/sulfite reductase [Kiritimatiellia bacterium]
MTKRYEKLEEAFRMYERGELTPETIKPVVACYGIYQQRDDAFMARVRVCGGEVPCANLRALADLLEPFGARAHLTTRQDIQIHDLPAAQVTQVVTACDALGYPFRGGGGNTYRNLVVGPLSGLSASGCFDVYPYAYAVNRALMASDIAFQLPRKFKIGFFADAADALRAAVHDVGFVATLRDGERGFVLTGGGGLGRESRVGVRLSPFLPAGDAVRAALAAVSLFHAYGDRENRHQARLRFVLKRLGDEAFRERFWQIFNETACDKTEPEMPETALPDGFAARAATAQPNVAQPVDARFDVWRRMAVSPTRFGEAVRAVRLFVPYGNLSAVQLRAVARVAEEVGSPFVRVLPTQDLLIPFVADAALPVLYTRLRHELNGLDVTFDSYKGHVITCVGATVCRIGVGDAPSLGDALAAELDRYLPADTPEKLRLFRRVVDDVRISGCPNACAAHPAARYGIQCVKKRQADGTVVTLGQLFIGTGIGPDGVAQLSEADPLGPLSPADLAERIARGCEE